MFKLILFAGLVLLSLSATAQPRENEFDWVLKRDRSGIRVYTAKVEGSKYRAVSTSMRIEARVDSLVGLVMDLKNCQNWVAMCKLARTEKRISVTQSYVYTVNDLPFPVRDRDMLNHVIWRKDPETGAVSMDSRATKGLIPKKGYIIRINEAVSQWYFTPQGNGIVLVESFAHVNPNGPVPAWVLNRLLVGTPYRSMKRMREIIKAGGYADAQHDF